MGNKPSSTYKSKSTQYNPSNKFQTLEEDDTNITTADVNSVIKNSKTSQKSGSAEVRHVTPQGSDVSSNSKIIKYKSTSMTSPNKTQPQLTTKTEIRHISQLVDIETANNPKNHSMDMDLPPSTSSNISTTAKKIPQLAPLSANPEEDPTPK